MAGIGSRRFFRVVKCSCTEHGWLTIGVGSGIDGKRSYSFSFRIHRDLWYVRQMWVYRQMDGPACGEVSWRWTQSQCRRLVCSANTASTDLPIAVCKYRRQVVIEHTNATSVLAVGHSKRQWFFRYE